MKLAILAFVFSSLTPVAAGDHGCPSGLVQYERSCYLFSRESKSFKQAKAYCHRIGSHLAIITNKCEDDFLRSIAKGEGYWLGATDVNKEGTWIWENHQAMTYSNWYPGQPDNGSGTEHCLHMLQRYGNYQWNDDQCYNRLPFICEREL